VDRVLYLDNAATSWPKPPETAQAMLRFMEAVGANPGRSGHRLSVEAARVVYGAREAVAELCNAPDPLRVVFGANATEALNLAFAGLVRPGDHVVTSSMEHNSLMRPLRALAERGAALTVVRCSPAGELDPAAVEAALRPETRLIAVTHASNVVGTLLPVAELGALARRRGILLLVDAAQTLGAYPIDMRADAIDLLAFTGHKSLCGPMGTGGLVLGERVDAGKLEPLMRGGTGSQSERKEQPRFLPDAYESGTPNTVGLAGLAAGARWVLDQGVARVRARESALTARLLEALGAIPGVTLYGSRDAAQRVAVVAFNIDAVNPSEVVGRLDEDFGIMSRGGLHCAPAAHRTVGTFPRGAVRFGFGPLSGEDDAAAAAAAVAAIAEEAR